MSAANTATPVARELLGEHLQRAGLAGAGRAGDEAVAVHHRERDAHRHVGIGLVVLDHEGTQFQRRTLKAIARTYRFKLIACHIRKRSDLSTSDRLFVIARVAKWFRRGKVAHGDRAERLRYC